MAGTVGRYARVIKFVKEAEELARSGSLVLDDGESAIYFLWGQPSHAYTKRDNARIEGEAALKEIAMDLARPGKVEWNNRDVLQVETLRCNAEELIQILQSMAAAGKEPPADEAPLFGKPSAPPPPRPTVTEYNFEAFPFLPTGGVIWAEVPTNVVHLDVLLGALPTVLVTMEAPGAQAAGVVLRGELFDAIAVTDRKLKGREAWDFLLACDNGLVSAFEVTEDLAETLPILWRHRLLTGGIESKWFDPSAFADSQVGAEEDRAVVISSSHGIGIGIFRRGHMVGSYSNNRPNVAATIDPLSELVGPNFTGKVNIIERIAEDEGEPFVVSKPVEAPIPEPVDEAPATYVAPELELVPRDFPPSIFAAAMPSIPTPAAPPKPPVPPPVVESPPVYEPPPLVFETSPTNIVEPPAEVPPPEPTSNGSTTSDGGADYGAIVTEMMAIGERFLHKDFAAVAPILENCERSPEGLREAITAVRDAELPNQSPDRIRAAARAMQIYVADMISGT